VKKILVIDDEDLLIRTLNSLLTKHKYEVYSVMNGSDAKVMIEEEEFELIICDMQMPGLNGVETIKEIKNAIKLKNAKDIPVIFITGYADTDLEKQAKDLKPVAYIFKPFEIPVILDAIKSALKL